MTFTFTNNHVVWNDTHRLYDPDGLLVQLEREHDAADKAGDLNAAKAARHFHSELTDAVLERDRALRLAVSA